MYNMKYVGLGDIHGALNKLKEIEKAINVIEPDYVLITGDFDQTKVIHEVMNMEQNLKERGIEVKIIKGNHDDAIENGIEIYSGTLWEQGTNSRFLHYELLEDEEAYNFIKNLKDEETFCLDKEKFGKAYETVLIHGGYDGDLSSCPGCSDERKKYWVRFREGERGKEDYNKNFKKMEEFEKDIMIRGHDHKPQYAYQDPRKGIVIYDVDNGTMFRLFKNRKHVITTGALYDGWYVVINTEFSGEDVPVAIYNKL